MKGILYDGPSALDGARIVAIATDRTKNAKTGDMVQVWILRADANPVRAARLGRDASVCGACPLRPRTSGACYVRLQNAPLSVWRSWRRGNYAKIEPSALAGQNIRLGAYGDPAALPVELVRELRSVGRTVTGYTHSWKTSPDLRGLVMASCDTPKAAEHAIAAGWGVFRAGARDSSDRGSATLCAAENGATCASCGACDGRPSHVYIPSHGPMAKHHPAEKRRLAMVA